MRVSNDASVCCFKAKPIPHALWEKLNAELDRLLAYGVMKPAELSDYVAPNGRIRICDDNKQTVNKVELADKYPILKIGRQ